MRRSLRSPPRSSGAGRENPSASASRNSPMCSGLKRNASQPSAISAARATFLGPSAPSTIGRSARSGCTIDLSGRPSRALRDKGAGSARPRWSQAPRGPAPDARWTRTRGCASRLGRAARTIPRRPEVPSTEAEHEAASAQVVEGDGGHGRGSRGTGRELAQRRPSRILVVREPNDASGVNASAVCL